MGQAVIDRIDAERHPCGRDGDNQAHPKLFESFAQHIWARLKELWAPSSNAVSVLLRKDKEAQRFKVSGVIARNGQEDPSLTENTLDPLFPPSVAQENVRHSGHPIPHFRTKEGGGKLVDNLDPGLVCTWQTHSHDSVDRRTPKSVFRTLRRHLEVCALILTDIPPFTPDGLFVGWRKRNINGQRTDQISSR